MAAKPCFVLVPINSPATLRKQSGVSPAHLPEQVVNDIHLRVRHIEAMSEDPSPRLAPTLETIPPEVLEHIAFFVATSELKGPPSSLIALCCTSKSVNASLGFSVNPSLYAAIFRFKFDVDAPMRRLGPESMAAQCLASELRKRFEGMKRIKMGVGSRLSEDVDPETDLWMAVFMMLENEGKNALQLKHFAMVEQWLLEFFLDHSGGSYASNDMFSKSWPRENHPNKLAMWLLWLCDADELSLNYSAEIRGRYCDVLCAYALGANNYPLTPHSWSNFSHPYKAPNMNRPVYHHYNRPLVPTAPAISTPAILAYISRLKAQGRPSTLGLTLSTVGEPLSEPVSHSVHSKGVSPSKASFSQQWDCDWERCIGHDFRGNSVNNLDRFHRPGTLEGAWEGIFTFTEFSVYGALLSGAPPQVLHEGAIGQNRQVWKLREYDLYSSSTPIFPLDPSQGALPPGEALDGFFPHTIIEEKDDHVVFAHASKEFVYSRARPSAQGTDTTRRKNLCDVIILGEGHSSWGDFKLRGRVRASDAFVTVLKEYNDEDDRGRWLYRGFLVGGRLAGRWRDVLSPLGQDGYEGGFELTRRA